MVWYGMVEVCLWQMISCFCFNEHVGIKLRKENFMTVEAVGYTPVQPQKKTGGAGKAWASVFIPGLGQFLDGRNKEGAGYMGASIAAGLGSHALVGSLSKDIFNASKAASAAGAQFDVGKYLSKLPKGKMWGMAALGLASTALWIANIVDAYKGKKS